MIEDSTFCTFVSHTFHFVDCFLAILLSQMFGFLHRLAQEFLKLGSDGIEEDSKGLNSLQTTITSFRYMWSDCAYVFCFSFPPSVSASGGWDLSSSSDCAASFLEHIFAIMPPDFKRLLNGKAANMKTYNSLYSVVYYLSFYSSWTV